MPTRAKKIATISTVIWKERASHARNLVGKYLFGNNEDGQPPRPRSEVVSLYTHQTPDDDISREWSARTWHGVDVEGREEPLATMMWRHTPQIRSFDCMILNIEQMFETGRAPYPVERTLLVSGILDLVLESRLQGHVRIEIPQLDGAYQVDRRSFHCTGDPPAPWSS